ncbi:MAG: M6 family metalloprotease domain-containing protein, partial [Armatimonadetes bacterium]|nr:M6 family metalloprotease domain-containing protein [Armatimonadota bacterium]
MHLAIPSSQRSSRAHCAHRLMGAVLLAGLAVVLAAPVGAVPARPGLYTLRSPDGQVFQASLHGDEWHHWWQTPDGRIIEQDPAGRYVMKGAGRPMMSPQQAARRASARRGPQRAVPATGTGRIPVLCGNFSDTSTTYNPGDYQTLLFTGPQSMSAFYSENSYDQFTVDAGPEGVSGWYDVSNTHDYYGTNVAENDEHPAEFVIEVVEAADAAGFDFGPYDTDNDGYVDVVCIAHQGTDEAAGGPSTDIWSHSWDLNSASFFGDGTGEVTTSSGKKVNAYIIQPELQPNNDLVTIGVYCHEYGHALGLPDFYDYTGMSQGLGDWSLMAGGGWGGGDGSMPSHMDAWCKITLGWVTPIEPTTSVFGAQLPMAEQNPVMYKVTSLAADTEYYLIENRQQTGFDAALPGEGVLIYHVDDTRTSNDNTWYPGWTSFGHYWVALEQADGLWQLERFWAASPP